jgi:chromosomal replication initiation ATPase DnaA
MICTEIEYEGTVVFDKSKTDKASNLKNLCMKLSVILQIDITKKTNKREYAWARMIYYHLAKKDARHSLTSIGAAVFRDHSTVHYSLRKYGELYEFDREFRKYADTAIDKMMHWK